MDQLERDISPTRKFMGNSLVNAEGVKVVEGARMGIIANIDRVGSDSHGNYALATIDGRQFKLDLNLVTTIQNSPSSRF